MNITKETLLPMLIFNKPIKYDDNITLYPVTMNDIITFQTVISSITVRKNSIFHDKQIIKMSYLDFLIHCHNNEEIEKQYKISELSNYLLYAIQLLYLCCRNAEIQIIPQTQQIRINGEILSSKIFDDLRRIIIIQNDVDFDLDEFLNYDTEQRLLKAQKDLDKNEKRGNIEDYIDSLVIAMGISEEQVMKMTIRKFWRYIKRYQLHEGYTIAKTGEYSGMVTFKEPIQHWMTSLEDGDKFKHLKTDENELRDKIS